MMRRRGCALGDFRGVSAMQSVDTGGPVHGWMPQQLGAVVFQIQGQFHLQWILNLWRLQECSQQRGRREICDGESLTDKIRAALSLVLDAVKRRGDDGPIPLQIARVDSMAESVERWKNPKQRPQRGVGLATHTRRQHAQRNVWIVPEQRRHNSRAQRRPKRIVEIVLQRERALPHDGVTRIKRWLGVMLLKLSDD